MESHINERGNKVRVEPCERESYEISRFCKPELGWGRYRTVADTNRFGIWVNMESNQLAILSAGDFYIIECDNKKGFNGELDHLIDLYGEPKTFHGNKPEGKYALAFYVTFQGKQGVIRDKTFDTEIGWVYKVYFDDGEEWHEENDLEPVWR